MQDEEHASKDEAPVQLRAIAKEDAVTRPFLMSFVMPLRDDRGGFLMSAKEEAGTIAKGKYQKWLEPDGLILLQGWARDGLTDEQLAHNIGISVSTLDAWKNRFPEISAALKKGKAVVDFAVENALLKRAMSGDTTAQIFWLKNRRPDQWRDKPAPPDADTDLLKAAKELLGGVSSAVD